MTTPKTMLLDSNIIIYAAQPSYPQVREFVRKNDPAVSAISYVETLGFHKLLDTEKLLLQQFFSAAEMLPIDRPVLDRAVSLRQQRRMSLGDSIVAATSLVNGLILVTRNTNDFRWIPGLQLIDPLSP